MSVPERFYHINSSLCLMLGYLFNGVLQLLLAKHTTAEMAALRPILTITSLIDIGGIFFMWLVQLVVLANAGYSVGLSVGPLWWLPQPYNFALISLSMVWYVLHNNALTMVYVIRYLLICRGKKYGVYQFLGLLLISLVVALSWVVVIAKTGYVATAAEEQEAKMRFFPNETTTIMGRSGNRTYGDYVISYYRRPGSNAFARHMLLYLIVNYSLICYLGWRIYRHLTGMAQGHISGDHYRALQLQVSSTLLLQSLTPLVVVFVPSIAFAVAAASGMRVQGASAYYTAFITWEMVLNPLIVIWVIRAYRRAVFDWLGLLRNVVLGRATVASEGVDLTSTQHPYRTNARNGGKQSVATLPPTFNRSPSQHNISAMGAGGSRGSLANLPSYALRRTSLVDNKWPSARIAAPALPSSTLHKAVLMSRLNAAATPPSLHRMIATGKVLNGVASSQSPTLPGMVPIRE